MNNKSGYSEEMDSKINSKTEVFGDFDSNVKHLEKDKQIVVFSKELIEISKSINNMVKNVEEKSPISNFGEMSNEIMQSARKCLKSQIQKGTLTINGDSYKIDENNVSIFEDLIDNGLHVVFLKQIDAIKEKALNKFIIELEEEQHQNEFSVFNADSFFISEAEKALRPGSSWSYSKERANLQRTMQDMSKRKKLLIAEKIKSGEQQAYSFQLLQQQQSQIHSLQQQQYGGTPTLWNLGIAYRPPDSIFNVSAGYQQGKANIQITMIPDEHASLLGSTGFTSGVGPGNLGISLNLNI
jgi:hypothetical protein